MTKPAQNNGLQLSARNSGSAVEHQNETSQPYQQFDHEEAVPTEWKPGRQELIILGTMATLALIIALDATILAPALPSLALALNGAAIETFWTGTSYLLAYAVFLPLIGAGSNLFGRRLAVLFSLIMFTVGTVLCCAANAFPQMLAGRTVQGIGGGGIFVLGSIVLSDIVRFYPLHRTQSMVLGSEKVDKQQIPLRQRPKYQSVIAAAWGLGAILGPLTGGLITEHTTWRWLFYVNFPFCAIGFIIIPFSFKLKPIGQRSILDSLKLVDWIGGFLFIAGTSAFLIGITWGGVQYEWSSFKAWLPILLGALTTIGALIYDGLIPAEPFLVLSVFDSISASVVYVQTIIQGFILYAQLYYLPFYLTSVKELSATVTGIFLMAVNIILLPSSVIAGLVMTRWGTFTWAIKIGFVILTIGDGLLIYLDQHRRIVDHVFIFLVSGIGHGFLLGSLEAATNAIAKPAKITYAISMYYFMRSLGLCIGVAAGGAVFSNIFLKALQNKNIPEAKAIAANSEAFVEVMRAMTPGYEKSQLMDAYVEGFHGVFYLLVSLAGFATAVSFLIKHHNMDQQLEPEHRQHKAGGDRQVPEA